MSPARTAAALAAAVTLVASPAGAITIELDYSLDSNGFFDQPGARDAMRAAADFYQSALTDSLAQIRPSGSNTWSIRFYHPGTDNPVSVSNPTIAADTVRIYVGGFAIPGNSVGIGGPGGWSAEGTAGWLTTIDKRGAPDGGTTTGTDFTPWGGSISFDTTEPWHFSTTTADLPGTSFISTALHEVGHILGLGTAGAWDNLIDGPTRAFTGPEAVARFGTTIPVTSNLGHFRDDAVCNAAFPEGYDPDNPNNILSRTFSMFGTPAGRPQISVMDPSNCSIGPFLKVVTEVDLAALDDIGWDVVYPNAEPAPVPVLTVSVDPQTGHPTISWPTVSGHTYQLQQNPLLAGWSSLGGIVEGDDQVTAFTHTDAPANGNSYRVVVDPPPYAASPPPGDDDKAAAKPGKLLELLKARRPARHCRDCTAGTAHRH